MIAEFEQEKFEMQKQHTKNIQDILDDTNTRLQKMEKEYGQQTASTVGQRSFLFIAKQIDCCGCVNILWWE